METQGWEMEASGYFQLTRQGFRSLQTANATDNLAEKRTKEVYFEK